MHSSELQIVFGESNTSADYTDYADYNPGTVCDLKDRSGTFEVTNWNLKDRLSAIMLKIKTPAIVACEAGVSVKPGVERSGTPGIVDEIKKVREAADSGNELLSHPLSPASRA